MAFYQALILSVMYISTINAQKFCDEVTKRGDTCFSAPSKCSTVDDCEMTMTAVDRDDAFEITLTGKSDGWIAIGFSKDELMGSDDVIMCINDGSRISLEHRFNEKSKKANVASTDLGGDLVLTGQSYNQGLISCTFNRSKSGDAAKNAFRLKGTSWYLLFARGPVIEGKPRIHNEFPWNSQGTGDLASGKIIPITRRPGNPTLPTPPDERQTNTEIPDKGVKSPVGVPVIITLLLACILFF